MARLAWLLSPDLGREKLALLIFCTWTLYVLAVNLAWQWLGGQIPRSPAIRAAGGMLGFLYGAGIPLAALWRGVSIHKIGIPTTWAIQHGELGRWLGAAGLEIGLLPQVGWVWLLGVGLFAAVWVWYVRAVGGGSFQSPTPWWRALLCAISLQMLWALYRYFASTLTDNVVHASFIALTLAAAAWMFDPFLRHGLASPDGHTSIVRDWALLLLTAWAAIQFRSLWLLIGLHWTWLWISDLVLQFIERRYALSGAA